MKRRTEKLSDQVMRYFTPDLYVRFNSQDDEVANRADEEWEAALKQYSTHLKYLRPWMPYEVKKLSDLYLHDAEVIDFQIDEHCGSPFQCPRAEFLLKQNGRSITLEYILSGKVRYFNFGVEWPFSKECPLWLYEEIDIADDPGGMFLHRVLLSDGRVIVIPFKWVRIRTRQLPSVGESQTVRQGAL